MTSKERILLALNREKPDRLPVTIHQWQKYHLDTVMGGVSDYEAFKMTGLDPAIQYGTSQGTFGSSDPEELRRYSTPQWKCSMKVVSQDGENAIIDHTIQTPEGALTYRTGKDAKTTWIIDHMIKRDEDIYIIEKYMPTTTPDKKDIERAYDRLGDDGILRGWPWGDQGGAWQHACCLYDPTAMILATFDKPDWVHELMRIIVTKKLEYIEKMKGCKFDLVETGGGSASSTLISPELHAEFCTPYDKMMHDALHDLGFLVAYHTCGGTLGIEEHIVANGCDVSETMAPISVGGNQEPWDFKRKIGNRLGLIGGVDQFNTLTTGTKEQIRANVHELFEKVGYEGGYVCAASDHFFDTPIENLKAFAEAAKECVY